MLKYVDPMSAPQDGKQAQQASKNVPNVRNTSLLTHSKNCSGKKGRELWLTLELQVPVSTPLS